MLSEEKQNDDSRGRYTNFKVWTYEKCIAFIDGFIWDGFCSVSVQ